MLMRRLPGSTNIHPRHTYTFYDVYCTLVFLCCCRASGHQLLLFQGTSPFLLLSIIAMTGKRWEGGRWLHFDSFDRAQFVNVIGNWRAGPRSRSSFTCIIVYWARALLQNDPLRYYPFSRTSNVVTIDSQR